MWIRFIPGELGPLVVWGFVWLAGATGLPQWGVMSGAR